jgi:phosphomannomutase
MIISLPSEIRANKDKLFKPTAYDIRAYVGKPGNFFSADAVLTPQAMYVAGALMGSVNFRLNDGSTVSLVPGDKVVVGYDNGPTSPALAQAFAEGLNSQGVDVYNIGVSSSGQVYHNEVQLNAQGHVQITRSHVEVTTNGAKFAVKGQGIHTYLLGQMNAALSAETAGRECAEGRTESKEDEGLKLYTEKMIARYKSYFREHHRLIAVNLFGGTGVKYKSLYQEVFGNVMILGDELDVNSGGLLADPTRSEMLAQVPSFSDALTSGLRVHSFDLDADRGSVTERNGHYLGDSLAYILADYKLKIAVPALMTALSKKGLSVETADETFKLATTVYVDPRYTSGVTGFVAEAGGRTEYHPKGHSLWKETIASNIKKLAKLAGYASVPEFVQDTGWQDIQIEASLHLFVTDQLDGVPRDDAVENVFILEKIFDALKIKSLELYFNHIPRKYATKEIRTNAASNEAKDAITADVIRILKESFRPDKFLLVEFDGQLRVEWGSGFIMYGMSNTSPKLTFMAEGSGIAERNRALAYILALHNESKARFGDATPMDISENSFFADDSSYNMSEPDGINMQEPRAQAFLKEHNL